MNEGKPISSQFLASRTLCSLAKVVSFAKFLIAWLFGGFCVAKVSSKSPPFCEDYCKAWKECRISMPKFSKTLSLTPVFCTPAPHSRYSKALDRTITFQDIPVEPWRDGLLERGLPVHLVNHLATMADLHRAGRYDRMSDDVRRLTGQGPLCVQEFVRKNAATFTASATAA